MKKVGVLNLPRDGNYGGMLQAVALHHFLNERGYEVKSIGNAGGESVRFNPFLRNIVFWLLERIPLQNVKGLRRKYKAVSRHREFMSRYIRHQTRKLRSENEFRRIAEQEKFDAIVVGSDQVWRWEYISHDPKRYFLGFADSATSRKIAYAASFGTDHWQAPELLGEIKPLLAEFHAVSTRERSGVAICESMGRHDCRHVLDPTLLVEAEFYDQMIVPPQAGGQGEKRFLTYILDKARDKTALVGDVKEMLGEGWVLHELGLQSDVSVPQWVSQFKHADFVVTDSFHGTVFAIIFRKRFIALGNSLRGLSRFRSLLERFGLDSRLMLDTYSNKELLANLVSAHVEYGTVDELLPKLQEESARFLVDAIEGRPG